MNDDLREGLLEAGYGSNNDPHVFVLDHPEDEGLEEWMRENKIMYRWIDLRFEKGDYKFIEGEGKLLLYVPDDTQYILTKMRWT